VISQTFDISLFPVRRRLIAKTGTATEQADKL
jgi:hypothetical protein